MHRLLVLLALLGSAGAANLSAQRSDTIKAVGRYVQAHRTVLTRCGVPDWDANRVSVMAFPSGRADRMYVFMGGVLYEYVVGGARVRLRWCGNRRESAHPTRLISALATEFQGRFHTTSGAANPEPFGLDVYEALNADLTVRRINVQGRVMCEKTWPMPNFTLTLPSPDNLRYGCP